MQHPFPTRRFSVLEAVFELVDRQRACDQPGAVAAPDDKWLRQLAALRQVAGDRLEDVGEGGDAFGRAVLVDHHRHVDALAAETIEQLRSEEHTSELQSLMRISYAVF